MHHLHATLKKAAMVWRYSVPPWIKFGISTTRVRLRQCRKLPPWGGTSAPWLSTPDSTLYSHGTWLERVCRTSSSCPEDCTVFHDNILTRRGLVNLEGVHVDASRQWRTSLQDKGSHGGKHTLRESDTLCMAHSSSDHHNSALFH